MARLIFKAPYYKPVKNAKNGQSRGAYAKYIATRDGVELLQSRSGIADYINERKGSNGMFSDKGIVINLSQISKEIDEHKGNVWGLIFSLKREDAERLGYNSAEQWMDLLRSRRNDIAKEMRIAPNNLRWYAAYHNSETHPHVHMLVWSENPHEPHLSTTGIHNIKHTVANDIFRQDLISVYKNQTETRDQIKENFRKRMDLLLSDLSNGNFDFNLEIILKFEKLREKINEHKGKKVYGYLNKSTKSLVDEIVKLVANDEKISELYDLWYAHKCETYRTYTDVMPEKILLEENDEFKSLRNAVVKMAVEFEFSNSFPREKAKEPSNEHSNSSISDLKLYAEFGDKYAMYKLGKLYLENHDDADEAEFWLRESAEENYIHAIFLLYECYRDGKFSDKDNSEMRYLMMAVNRGYAPAEYEYGRILREENPSAAMELFRKSAWHGSDCGSYAYAKMLYEYGEIEEAKEYFERAAANNPMLQMRVGLEYCYRFNDWERGKEHLNSSAEKGFNPAKEAMKVINQGLDARIIIGVLDLFYYAGNIIDERADYYSSDEADQGVDKKLRNEIRMKREGWGMSMR